MALCWASMRRDSLQLVYWMEVLLEPVSLCFIFNHRLAMAEAWIILLRQKRAGIRHAAWQTCSMLFTRIHRRCCDGTALGSREEALVHLGVAARLLEELLIMLFENVIDYIDRFVSILHGSTVDAVAATLLVQTRSIVQLLVRNVISTAVKPQSYITGLLAIYFGGNLEDFGIKFWKIVLLKDFVDSVMDCFEKLSIRWDSLYFRLNFFLLHCLFNLLNFLNIDQHFGFVLQRKLSIPLKVLVIQHLSLGARRRFLSWPRWIRCLLGTHQGQTLLITTDDVLILVFIAPFGTFLSLDLV